MSMDRGVGEDIIESLLMDGRIISIRHVRDDDEQALLGLHRRASIQSRYYRFFSAGVSFEPEVRRLRPAPTMTRSRCSPSTISTVIAVGSYVRLDDDTAEFALLVDDLWHDEGVGTLLLESLAAEAAPGRDRLARRRRAVQQLADARGRRGCSAEPLPAGRLGL